MESGDESGLLRIRVGTSRRSPMICAVAFTRGCRTNPAVRTVLDHPDMAQNFLTCDRDQPLLLPPDLHDWLEEDHLAWFVIEAIEELDLDAFYASYRADGHGRAAHDPKMMLTLLTYAYAVGERSSRGIERRCREDVAFRVICANQTPDHATIAASGCATNRRCRTSSARCSDSAPRR